MAITFAYTESTNQVVVTEGTSGTPATFADFVTADRAGTAVLLVAESCTTNHTLTYAIRPVEDLAITIDFVLSGTSAGAGDTLDVTGTLFDGSVQTDNIDVSGGDATYNGSYKWASISDIDCTGWADGTLAVNQGQWGVIWDYGLSQYQLDSFFTVGNDSTSTYFRTDNETITWSTGVTPTPTYPLVKSNATFYSGTLTENMGVDGSVFNFWPSAHIYLFTSWEGTVYFYGCRFNVKAGYRLYFNNNTNLTMTDCVVNLESGSNDLFLPGPCTITRLTVASTDGGGGIEPTGQAPAVNGYLTNGAQIRSWIANEFIFTEPNLLNTTTQELHQGQAVTITITDPTAFAPTAITIYNASGIIRERYTINIHVVDKDGANLSGAVVDCAETGGTAVWTAGSVTTDANGDITEQTITYRKWEGTSETLTTYSPHRFTVYLPGYETLVIDNVTVDDPIVWHLEMQPLRARVYGRSHRIQASQFL